MIKNELKPDLIINQNGITDYFFTATEQKVMKTWDDPEAAEYTTSREYGENKGQDAETDEDMNPSFCDFAKLSASHVKKVDMKSVTSVCGSGEDDADALQSFTLDVVKKGADTAGIQKSAKDLMAASKKKKKAAKAKTGRHLASAMLDAVVKPVTKKQVTKPMKESDVAE